MKTLIALFVLALAGVALSCEKEPISFAEEEELTWRSVGEPEGAKEWSEFSGEVILVSREAPTPVVPSTELLEAEVRKPAPPAITYSLTGELDLLGYLDSKGSEEKHYGPYPSYRTNVFRYKVSGRMSNKFGHMLDYTGICLYYANGKRVGEYTFINGTGPFARVEGEFTAEGKFNEKEGKTVMKIHGKVNPAIFVK